MTDHVLESMNEVISYDYSATHEAVDIVGAGHSVDDVIAFSDGVVEIVVKDVKYTNHNTEGTDTYGNFVKIKHDDGTKSLYAHLKYGSVLVFKGQRVSKGQKIGTMGATGNAYGTHLHFEIRNSNDVRVNPKDYLYKPVSASIEISEEPTIQEEQTETTETSDTISTTEAVSTKETQTNQTTENPQEVKTNTSSKSTNQEKTNTYIGNSSYKDGSIVDGLKAINVDSTFKNRTTIANQNGISNYKGTYNQNVYLLKLLKQGKLKI